MDVRFAAVEMLRKRDKRFGQRSGYHDVYIYIYVDNVIIFMLGCCAFIAEIAVASPLNHKIGILSVNRNVMRVSRGK